MRTPFRRGASAHGLLALLTLGAPSLVFAQAGAAPADAPPPAGATAPASAPSSASAPAPAGAPAAAGAPTTAIAPEKAGPPFVLDVEQVVPLAPASWDVLELRRLDSEVVNATSEAARSAVAAQRDALKARLDDGACVLLGRSTLAGGAGRNGASAAGTAVLVPEGLRGRAVAVGSSVRVTPSAAPWPSMALSEAARAFPELRLYGTSERPGFVAAAVESLPAPAENAKAPAPSPPSATAWGRASARSLPASAGLIADAPVAGRPVDRWVPMSVTIRNSSQTAMPPCEVFVEFLGANGEIVHREFRWLTERDSVASENRLPALAPGASTTVRVPVPPAIATQATGARVLVVKLLAPKAT